MQTQKILYSSKGIPQKTKKIFQIASKIVLAAGVLFMLLPLVSDAPTAFVFIGVIYIGLGILMPRATASQNKGRLVVLENQIKGIAIGVTNASGDNFSFDRLGEPFRSTVTPFQLDFDQISDVQKSSLYTITLCSGDKRYNIPVQDREKAYSVICDKVFGEASASTCIKCGATISATTQNCSKCGHLTRYGKINTETTSKQNASQKDQLKTVIGVGVGIVGLFIFIPALIELNEISEYASLYAAFHPTESKQLVFKVIAGLFLTVCGFAYPVSNKLVNKLQGK